MKETEALEDELTGKRAVLRFLSRFVPSDAPKRSKSYRMLDVGPSARDAFRNGQDHPQLTSWQAAHAGLLTNADAELPG
jgi:hypothetical protein